MFGFLPGRTIYWGVDLMEHAGEKEQTVTHYDHEGKEIKPNKDWYPFAMLCLGISVGLFLGYTLNVESQAKTMANGQCGIAISNLDKMIGNFNVLVQKCPKVLGAKELPVLGTNYTVVGYA